MDPADWELHYCVAMVGSSGSVPDSGIGAILVSSRSLAEYRAMFGLSDDDLRRKILDCPGGAASLTAEINQAGGDAIACDPIYARRDADELAHIAQAETDRGNQYLRSHPEQYRWTYFADPEDHHRSRSAAGALFSLDYRVHPERYVAGGIPTLPFRERSFDLVLSSHLLFSYADRLNVAFHRAGVLELMRVTRDELRIFPLVAMGSVRYPHLELLLTQLDHEGVTSNVVDVDYEFQVGGNQMLVCKRRPVLAP
jgi:SAM-dependent methyltransferase